MKIVKAAILVIILSSGLITSVQGLAAFVYPSKEVNVDQSIGQLRYFALQDGTPFCEAAYTGDRPVGVGSSPLIVQNSNDPQFKYMAASPYYKVFFKDTVMRMKLKNAWIELALPEQEFGKILNIKSVAQENALSVSNVFESVDLSYIVNTSVLTGGLTLKTSKELDRIVFTISWEGVTPVFQEDGSILFLNENGRVVKLLPPFMEDAEGSVCTDVHYELIETETGYELHKVIEEKGLEWLEKAVYPVIIDPSVQTFEDAWESSGLTPYGQYFQNLREYVNPTNGHLTVAQTDLVIPGRGIDLVVSRVYETPAVSYGGDPYEYEYPPVDIGKGWQLDFPFIGDEYLHLWGSTLYKMEWSGNTFENHEGNHFVLVKNGDNTYTLTTAGGIVYKFSTSGKLTEIKDLNQNTITFNYSSGTLTSITDTIGRTVNFSYSNGRLKKIIYNGAEIEYGYSDGCLVWMDDFLDRRTSYYYDSGFTEEFDYGSGWAYKENKWLLTKIVYPTTGYTTYAYSRYEDSHYYKYYVTHQRVYETTQVRHAAFTYTGSFSAITSCVTMMKNQSDITKGSYHFSINSTGLIYKKIVKNASGIPIRKYIYVHTYIYVHKVHICPYCFTRNSRKAG